MRFLTDCEWEGGASEAEIIAMLEALPDATSDAAEATATAETSEIAIDLSEFAELNDDGDEHTPRPASLGLLSGMGPL